MSRPTKIRQAPATKVGGGDYFDGTIYRSGTPVLDPNNDNIGSIMAFAVSRSMNRDRLTKAEYEAAKVAHERFQERSKQFSKDYSELQSSIMSDRSIPLLKKEAALFSALEQRGYGKNEIDLGGEITVQDVEGSHVETRPPSLIGGPVAPEAKKANAMAQMAIPEYDLEGKVNLQPQRIEAKRSGYDPRIERKIGLLGSKTNRAINETNAAKLEHINLVKEANQQIGAPDRSKYGYTPGSANEAYAYAQEKADSMNGKNDVKNVEKYFANADAYAKSIKANAEARGAEIQGKFDSAGNQVAQSGRLSSIINHLAQRQQSNAQTQQAQAQTQGLLNSGPSVFQSNLPDNSIAGMMR
jgi:hypothetical protein